MSKSPNDCSGFSLLEVLVAFSILGLSLGVLLNIFGRGTRIAALSDEYGQAVVLAESLLAETADGSPLEPGERSGGEESGYRWQIRVTPLLLPDQAEIESQGLNFPYTPFQIDVTVAWGTEPPGRTIRLSTLRLANRDSFEASRFRSGLRR